MQRSTSLFKTKI